MVRTWPHVDDSGLPPARGAMASPWTWNRHLPMTIYRSHETYSECAWKAHHSCSVCVKDNTLKPTPFHRDVLCWLSYHFFLWHIKICSLALGGGMLQPSALGPLQKLFLLKGYFCKGPPYDLFLSWPFTFHFGLVGLLGLDFLSFWPCRLLGLAGGILWLFVALWAFRGLSFCSLWPSGPVASFLFGLAFWVFILVFWAFRGCIFLLL